MSPQIIKLVVNLVDVAMFALNAAPEVVDLYRKQRALIERMITEGRNPTPAEVGELNNQISILRAELFKGIDYPNTIASGFEVADNLPDTLQAGTPAITAGVSGNNTASGGAGGGAGSTSVADTGWQGNPNDAAS